MSKYPRSITCKNLKYLREVTKLEKVEEYSPWKIKCQLPVVSVPDSEKWRLGLLSNLFNIRLEKHLKVLDNKKICTMIDSLCST